MNRNIKFTLVLFLFFTSHIIAQQKNIWSKIENVKLNNSNLQIKTNVNKYTLFELDYISLQDYLLKVPINKTIQKSEFIVKFPDENGKMISFYIKETPVIHPDLAKKYPNNKSYSGVGVDDSSLRIKFSVNEIGLYAMIIGIGKSIQYIDPLTKDNRKYKIYQRKDMKFENIDFQCFTKKSTVSGKSVKKQKIVNDLKLRTFRLALAGTGEYSQFHINQAGQSGSSDAVKKATVLAAMTTAITRINGILENDLAISFQLVANNDDLIFLDSTTDPYTNDDGSVMLNENQTTCNNVIGSSNYDIGHVFSTGGGGVAILASACTSSKAKGVTGSSFPTGDNYYFDFVAHEFGHQLGANHTFNGDTGNCAGANRNDATAVEPGSGSTLMAYAGLCSPQNVQTHSDFYFHIVSIEEIWTNINSGNSTCGTKTNLTTNLNVPVVNAGNDLIIPNSTPYVLKGQGSDADNDPISFCWEQIDNQITTIPPSETSTSGALYRSINPTQSAERYMPSKNTVINGSISSLWEVTPSVAREMNFKLTVRDNNPEAGQVVSDEMKVTVSGNAGPFVVTSQNADNLVWTENTAELIEWDVAGTTANGINVSNVNILLSLDGGKNFDTVLVSNTPNDGSESITVPNTSASKCFIKVEAVGNVFYAVNQKVFSIGEFTETCVTFNSTDVPISIPDNNPTGATSTINITDVFNIEKAIVYVSIAHTYVEDLFLTLESPNGTIVELLSSSCGDANDIEVTFDDFGTNLVCGTNPAVSGTIKPTQPLSTLINESSEGVWKLKVVDNGPADLGEITNWSLELCKSEPVLGVNNYVFNNFKVFPNPSSGLINIEFDSRNSSDVSIVIYDFLGRKVAEELFRTNKTNFREKLNLNNLSRGIYILQVKRGNEISSQKIQLN